MERHMSIEDTTAVLSAACPECEADVRFDRTPLAGQVVQCVVGGQIGRYRRRFRGGQPRGLGSGQARLGDHVRGHGSVGEGDDLVADRHDVGVDRVADRGDGADALPAQHGRLVVLPGIQADGQQHVAVAQRGVRDLDGDLVGSGAGARYRGEPEVVQDAGGGNFYVSDRTSWFPSFNSFKDYATYDLTFRVPKGQTFTAQPETGPYADMPESERP